MFNGIDSCITSIPDAVTRLKNVKDGQEFSIFLAGLRTFLQKLDSSPQCLMELEQRAYYVINEYSDKETRDNLDAARKRVREYLEKIMTGCPADDRLLTVLIFCSFSRKSNIGPYRRSLMSSLKKMDVFYQGRKVGTLAETRDRLVAFEYDSIWLSEGFPISPFSLPLEKKVFLPKSEPFEGLYGAFADSLPDGWGRLPCRTSVLTDSQVSAGSGDPNLMCASAVLPVGLISFLIKGKPVVKKCAAFPAGGVKIQCEGYRLRKP